MPDPSPSTRRLARAGVVTGAVAVVLAGGPVAAHVGGEPSVATAGSSTVFTLSVPHGCGDSPTTRLEIQLPEPVLSVVATRNPMWEVRTTVAELDEPVTDAHGNEVTERTDRVIYTARTALPDGVRDTFELSFVVPDAPGEVLAFPTIQSCVEGENAWVEVPADGQDPLELEHPAPMFEVLPAAEGGTAGADDAAAGEADRDGSDLPGWLGLGAGLLGLTAGLVALRRSRRTA